MVAWRLGRKAQLIAYNQQIDHWLTVHIKEAATYPALRETLAQYQTLTRQLAGNALINSKKQEVLALMAQDSNAEKAVSIAQNWGHFCWHTEWEFRNALLVLVQNRFEVSPDGRFSDDALDKALHSRNPYYGLSFRIGTLQGTPINVRIERNEGPMYYGLPYGTPDAEVRSRMRAASQRLMPYRRLGWPTEH